MTRYVKVYPAETVQEEAEWQAVSNRWFAKSYLPVSLNPTAHPEAVAMYRRRLRRQMRRP